MSSREQNTARRQSRRPVSRVQNIRTGIQALFTGTSVVGRRNNGSGQAPESPKTPRPVPTSQPVLGLQNLPTTRLVIPYLSRSGLDSRSHSRSNSRSDFDGSPSTPPPQPVHTPETAFSSRPVTPSTWQQLQRPNISTVASHARHNSSRRFVGVDPAEQHLAALAQDARRRRRRKNRMADTRRGKCGLKIKNRKIRSKLLSCFVSGLFLTLVLTIYLALALSKRNERQEFHVMLILVILLTTIFFCHSLIRLCMMLIHPPQEDEIPELPEIAGPGGYANPANPIRVALARDEEAAGIESEATKYPPPAYGLWRESVRVDPNRIFWQRNETAHLERENSRDSDRAEARPGTANRPPSYISEEGVDYVIEAQPRSIAPNRDVPLPVHPSERGRVWQGV